MNTFKYAICGAVGLLAGLTACTDLDEKVYDRIDASVYYQNEASVKGAVAAIYNQTSSTLAGENFFHLSEYPSDQITWRVWNGGQWGWDEAMKTVLSWHNWTSESTIINNAWSGAWTAVGLANLLLSDLEGLDAASLGMTPEKLAQYVAEVRTIRAWNYYCIFELWGGALPLNTSASSEVPGTADPDWNTSCKMIYDFIATELDETVGSLAKDDANHSMVNRANQGMNRLLKARLLLNAQVFIGEAHFDECEALSKEIIAGNYGNYALDDNYRNIYSIDNVKSPEVIFALAAEDGQGAANAISNVRTMVGMWYGYADYFGQSYDGIGAWNCVCLVPSYDNYGTVLPTGGTDGGRCFLDAPYGDKLGAPYERFDNRDIRKQNYVYDANTKTHGPGMFLKGTIRANFGTGDVLKADADRDGQDLVYVDQLGTFLNLGRNLDVVMNPRWGETNSGVRLVKYPCEISPLPQRRPWRLQEHRRRTVPSGRGLPQRCRMRDAQGQQRRSKELHRCHPHTLLQEQRPRQCTQHPRSWLQRFQPRLGALRVGQGISGRRQSPSHRPAPFRQIHTGPVVVLGPCHRRWCQPANPARPQVRVVSTATVGSRR